jgi:hypothetical protein
MRDFTKRVAESFPQASVKENRHVPSSQARRLQSRFRGRKAPFSVPRSVIETMHRATTELVASGAASRAKKAGDIAPDFSLKDPKSKAVSSPISSSAGHW